MVAVMSLFTTEDAEGTEFFLEIDRMTDSPHNQFSLMIN